jgi:hypothetical protein
LATTSLGSIPVTVPSKAKACLTASFCFRFPLADIYLGLEWQTYAPLWEPRRSGPGSLCVLPHKVAS